MKRKILPIFIGVLISFLFYGTNLSFGELKLNFFKARAASNLAGRILLQVQDKGQAWYLNPLSSKRYYLGRPRDAFNLIRTLGLGVSNSDLEIFKKKPPKRLVGYFLLQVQDKGQAYYLNPLDLKLYYLGRPRDAFNLMRTLGLGITNQDLALIPIAADSQNETKSNSKKFHHFIFKYQNKEYEIFQKFSSSLYQDYKNSPKTYIYNAQNPPSDLRNAFYSLFLKTKSEDDSLDNLISQLKLISIKNNWTSDQLLEFTMALVQYIPYDHAKLLATNNRNTDPYYPYETLYLNRGVCSDKTFLAVSLLRKLDYGTAILDFPDLNHSALGIACPLAESLNNSGYCYGETTNYFPLGVIPHSISAGQAQISDNEFSNLFDASSLGTIKIYQKTTGQIYQGIENTKQKIANIVALKANINSQKEKLISQQADISKQETVLKNIKAEMETYYNSSQFSAYNALVTTYNDLAKKYNSSLSDYQLLATDYNFQVRNFNQTINDFYQR